MPSDDELAIHRRLAYSEQVQHEGHDSLRELAGSSFVGRGTVQYVTANAQVAEGEDPDTATGTSITFIVGVDDATTSIRAIGISRTSTAGPSTARRTQLPRVVDSLGRASARDVRWAWPYSRLEPAPRAMRSAGESRYTTTRDLTPPFIERPSFGPRIADRRDSQATARYANRTDWSEYMSARRRLGVLAAAGAAAAALTIPAALQASASTGERFLAFGSQFGISGVTHEHFVTECHNVFSGPVTSGGATGALVANIDQVSVDGCNQGVGVTANALPWTVEGTNVVNGGSFSIRGVDVSITTGLGTCRYTGALQGSIDLQPNIYDIRGTLARQSAGCGGDQQISVSAVAEAVGVS